MVTSRYSSLSGTEAEGEGIAERPQQLMEVGPFARVSPPG
jgi:hypothetical protein